MQIGVSYTSFWYARLRPSGYGVVNDLVLRSSSLITL